MQTLIKQGIDLAPNHIRLYVSKAWTLFEMNKVNEAIECYKPGIKNNPKELSFYMSLSDLLLFAGNVSEAMECLN